MENNKNLNYGSASGKTAANAVNNQEVLKDSANTICKTMDSVKAKTASHVALAKEKFTKVKPAILAWLDKLPDRLGHAILRGLVIAIILNVIANTFWPELPETIPTVYGFFNGFLTVAEFLYKTALAGLYALFHGTFFEFGNSMMSEIGEMWNTFCAWISTIAF